MIYEDINYIIVFIVYFQSQDNMLQEHSQRIP